MSCVEQVREMLRSAPEVDYFWCAGAVVLVGQWSNEVGGPEMLVLCGDERLDR